MRVTFSRNIYLSLHLGEQSLNACWMPDTVPGAYKRNGQKVIIAIIMKSPLLVIHLIIQLDLIPRIVPDRGCALLELML